MDLEKIRELLQVVAESEVAEVSIEEDDFKITIRKKAAEVTMQPSSFFPAPYPMPMQGGYPAQPAAGQPPQAAPQPAAQKPTASEAPSETEAADAGSGTNEEVIKAPLVGTFYRRPAPDENAFVGVGESVEVGQVLCIIEAMKIMNEIESEMAGTIKEVLVEDGEPVEYDQPLFVIETA